MLAIVINDDAQLDAQAQGEDVPWAAPKRWACTAVPDRGGHDTVLEAMSEKKGVVGATGIEPVTLRV